MSGLQKEITKRVFPFMIGGALLFTGCKGNPNQPVYGEATLKCEGTDSETKPLYSDTRFRHSHFVKCEVNFDFKEPPVGEKALCNIGGIYSNRGNPNKRANQKPKDPFQNDIGYASSADPNQSEIPIDPLKIDGQNHYYFLEELMISCTYVPNPFDPRLNETGFSGRPLRVISTDRVANRFADNSSIIEYQEAVLEKESIDYVSTLFDLMSKGETEKLQSFPIPRGVVTELVMDTTTGRPVGLMISGRDKAGKFSLIYDRDPDNGSVSTTMLRINNTNVDRKDSSRYTNNQRAHEEYYAKHSYHRYGKGAGGDRITSRKYRIPTRRYT